MIEAVERFPQEGLSYKGDVSQFFIRGTNELVQWCEDETGTMKFHFESNASWYIEKCLMGLS